MKTDTKPALITDIPLPAWLDDPRSTQEIIFENFFSTALVDMAGGRPLAHLVREDPRGLSYTKLLNWIHKDEKRKGMYYQAQALGAEAVADEMLTIADAADNPLEDVQRSKLRIDTRKFLLEVWNKPRYGKESGKSGSGGGVTVVVQRGASVQLVAGEAEKQALEDNSRVIDHEPDNTAA